MSLIIFWFVTWSRLTRLSISVCIITSDHQVVVTSSRAPYLCHVNLQLPIKSRSQVADRLYTKKVQVEMSGLLTTR